MIYERIQNELSRVCCNAKIELIAPHFELLSLTKKGAAVSENGPGVDLLVRIQELMGLRPCFFGWLKQFNNSHPPSTNFNQL